MTFNKNFVWGPVGRPVLRLLNDPRSLEPSLAIWLYTIQWQIHWKQLAVFAFSFAYHGRCCFYGVENNEIWTLKCIRNDDSLLRPMLHVLYKQPTISMDFIRRQINCPSTCSTIRLARRVHSVSSRCACSGHSWPRSPGFAVPTNDNNSGRRLNASGARAPGPMTSLFTRAQSQKQQQSEKCSAWRHVRRMTTRDPR